MKSIYWQSTLVDALNNKTFCSHYVTLTLKRTVASKQNLPSILNYGREIVENNITQ